jgi:hypothetical protein
LNTGTLPIAILLQAAATTLATDTDPLRDRPILILAVFEFCLAGAYLALWRAAPNLKVFRGMGAYFALTAVEHSLRYFAGLQCEAFITALTSPILVEAAMDAMHMKRARWTRWLWPIYAFQFVAAFVPQLDFARSWGLNTSEVVIAWFAFNGLRRGSGRVRLVAAAFAIFILFRGTVSVDVQMLLHIPRYVEVNGWRTYFTSPCNVLLGVLTLIVCFRDLLQDRKEKERMAAELEAGRAVQQLLLSAPRSAGGHWSVETVYLPAAEVGGDFYALLSGRDDRSLLVIGDVSGKGLRAAMVVATIMGALRQQTAQGAVLCPGELLGNLNQTLCHSAFGGFATCLCAVLGPEQQLTFATAGHPVPYHNGAELPQPGSLPLGMAPDAAFQEVTISLEAGDCLTFISDGVLEAQDSTGELFGFDRTRAISKNSAETIASTAQQFGQNDDITVISLHRRPTETARDAVAETAETRLV